MRRVLGWFFRGLALVAALLATLPPVLGSLAFFRGGDAVNYTTLHLIVGGLLYNSALLLTVLAPFTLFRRRRVLLVLGLVQFGLLHVQLRLGLSARADVSLLAYHLPVGVLIFALTYLTAALGFGPRFEASYA